MLKMTDEQRYSALLKELGEVLASKNTTISCQSWEIDQLKEKLEAAEKELAFAKEKLEDASIVNGILMEDIAGLKGGAA